MGEIMKSNREEKTSTLNQGRPPHSEASPQQRLLLPTIQASGRRSPPPGKSFPETGSPGPPARERFPFRPVHTARSLTTRPIHPLSASPLGSARSRPGREATKRTLDGEDRFDTMKREGEGGL